MPAIEERRYRFKVTVHIDVQPVVPAADATEAACDLRVQHRLADLAIRTRQSLEDRLLTDWNNAVRGGWQP